MKFFLLTALALLATTTLAQDSRGVSTTDSAADSSTAPVATATEPAASLGEPATTDLAGSTPTDNAGAIVPPGPRIEGVGALAGVVALGIAAWA
jgi:hypothetical protein